MLAIEELIISDLQKHKAKCWFEDFYDILEIKNDMVGANWSQTLGTSFD